MEENPRGKENVHERHMMGRCATAFADALQNRMLPAGPASGSDWRNSENTPTLPPLDRLCGTIALGAPPGLKRMRHRHAIQEIEHRALAFDAYLAAALKHGDAPFACA